MNTMTCVCVCVCVCTLFLEFADQYGVQQCDICTDVTAFDADPDVTATFAHPVSAPVPPAAPTETKPPCMDTYCP